MPIKLAVFDIAGTTVADDNAVATAFSKAFGVYGYTVTKEDIKPLMGYKKPVAIHIMLEKTGAEMDEELVDDIHREFETEMLDYYEYSPDVRPMPGAEDVMMLLKENNIAMKVKMRFMILSVLCKAKNIISKVVIHPL